MLQDVVSKFVVYNRMEIPCHMACTFICICYDLIGHNHNHTVIIFCC